MRLTWHPIHLTILCARRKLKLLQMKWPSLGEWKPSAFRFFFCCVVLRSLADVFLSCTYIHLHFLAAGGMDPGRRGHHKRTIRKLEVRESRMPCLIPSWISWMEVPKISGKDMCPILKHQICQNSHWTVRITILPCLHPWTLCAVNTFMLYFFS